MKFKTYLFDFDGTLVDSMPSYISVMLKILEENNIKYSSDIVKIITPLGYAGTAKYFREIGLDMPENEIVAKMNSYASEKYKYLCRAFLGKHSSCTAALALFRQKQFIPRIGRRALLIFFLIFRGKQFK